jgi:glycosyltransferase involved in cell wall biosynthesis
VILHAGNPFSVPIRVRWLLEAGRLLPRPRDLVVVGCSVHVARSYRHAPYFRHLPVESCLNPVEAPPENPHRPRRLTPADPVRIGMVARLDPIKDHATLLRAFARLRAVWPRAELHLAGDGPLRPELERLATELGLAGTVHFHGSIAQVDEFLRSLDLFAYFTTNREGMGNALAEALAQGLPAVVNDLGVMREVGGDGEECAVRFTPAEPVTAAADLDAVLRDVAERAMLSERAFARASSWFAPRRVVERYLALLEVES